MTRLEFRLPLADGLPMDRIRELAAEAQAALTAWARGLGGEVLVAPAAIVIGDKGMDEMNRRSVGRRRKTG